MLYLKIENPGEAPVEGFTIFGASLNRDSDNTIGKFGSGSKHSVAVCLRISEQTDAPPINPIIYCGLERLDFFLTKETMRDEVSHTTLKLLNCKHSGQTAAGKSVNRTERLSFALDYGSFDWTELAMALREFISNAVDMASRKRNDSDGWKDVDIKVVDDSQIKAAAGTTRIFIPYTPEVKKFYENLGRWFLQFSEPYSVKQTVLRKGVDGYYRNMGNLYANTPDAARGAVIYRKGVRVREWSSDATPSLFDYNLNDIKIDESRNVNDYAIRQEIPMALVKAPVPILKAYLEALIENTGNMYRYMEFSIEHHHIYCIFGTLLLREQEQVIQNWGKAMELVQTTTSDKRYCFTTLALQDRVRAKGYEPIVVNSGLNTLLSKVKLPVAMDLLNDDEIQGRELLEPTAAVTTTATRIWKLILLFKLHGEQSVLPPLFCFTRAMEGGSQCHGEFSKGRVLIESSIAGESSVQLDQVMLEELGHYVTGAQDCSRDFQDWAFRFAAEVMRAASDASVGIIQHVTKPDALPSQQCCEHNQYRSLCPICSDLA